MAKVKRVLVVDDDPMWRERVSEAVRSLGHEPVAVAGAGAAGPQLVKEVFDLVITDNNMEFPDSGLELLQSMQTFNIRTPAILYTTGLLRRHRPRLARLAGPVFVQKSWESNAALVESIKRILA